MITIQPYRLYKKIRILIILFLLFSSKSYSQNKNELLIGGGYSQASQFLNKINLLQTSPWPQNIHNGYFAIEYYRNLDEKSSIGIGGQLVEKGFKNEYDIVNSQLTLNQKYFTKLDYVEIPVMYRLKIKYVFISVGILNSYLLKSANGTISHSQYYLGNPQDFRGSSYNPDIYKKYDIGYVLRLSYEVRKNIQFNFSFTKGFIRPYIYNSGEVNFNEVLLFGFSYKLI
jgi:hypothetical protein